MSPGLGRHIAFDLYLLARHGLRLQPYSPTTCSSARYDRFKPVLEVKNDILWIGTIRGGSHHDDRAMNIRLQQERHQAGGPSLDT